MGAWGLSSHPASPTLTLSVVSHGQGALVDQLLGDLAALADPPPLEVIVTRNIPEAHAYRNLAPRGRATTIIDNPAPLGFGHNHNQAFARSRGAWFCILNPDIRLPEDPFAALIACAERHRAAIVSPAVLGPDGGVEDHARSLPTLANLAWRRARRGAGSRRYRLGDPAFPVDWVAGMFMLTRRETYAALGGFDQRFFMYCEDIDLCRRAQAIDGGVWVCPATSVVHDARRESGRNWRHLRWHLASFARYFAKHAGRGAHRRNFGQASAFARRD